MSDQGPGPPLPAPYLSPWRRLGGDLRAVLADVGLSLRRLLRLNRQGALPLPGFWPQPLAALFWPLLIALGLALLSLGGGWLWHRQAREQVPRDQEQRSTVSLKQAGERPDQAPQAAAGPEAAAVSPEPIALPRQEVPAQEVPAQEGEPAAPDPLRALLDQPEAAGLLVGVRPEAGPVRLRFTLAVHFGDLPVPRQQDLAEHWLQWAHELGYEHLELWDGDGRLVAREALVGDGMILLKVRPLP